MLKSVKGALLSGLVLPGLGQMMFKRFLRGTVFMAACLGGLIAIMVKATTTALVIVERIGPTASLTDFSQMYSEVNQAVTEVDTTGYKLALLLILLSWVISTVDAYFLGRQIDQLEAADPDQDSDTFPPQEPNP